MSETAIVNQALALLGEGPIISLEDESNTASLARTLYEPNRDATLEDGNWRFATKWFKLNKLTTPPDAPSPFKNRFKIPTEALHVVFVGYDYNNKADYEIEEDAIAANVDTLFCSCIIKITDTTKYSRSFIQALSARLAAEMAIGVTGSAKTGQAMWELYEMKLQKATSRDQTQNTSRRIRSRWLGRGNGRLPR